MIDSNSTRRSPRRQSQEPPSTDRIRAWLFRARNGGNYFTVFRPFYRILSKLDTLFIQDLINLQTINKTLGDDGFFMCTAAYLEQIGWTVKEQELRFKSLTQIGGSRPFIRIERRGIPACRWVYIDIESVELTLDAVPENPDDKSPPIGGDCLPPIGGGINEFPHSSEILKKREEGGKSLRDVSAVSPAGNSSPKTTPPVPTPDNAVSVPATRARTGNVDQERVNCHTHRLNVEMGHPIAKQEIHRNGATPPVERTASVDKQTTNPGATVVDELLPPIPSPLDKSPGYSDFDVQLSDRILKFVKSNNWITYGKKSDRELALAVFRRKNKVTEAEMLSRWEWYEQAYAVGSTRITIKAVREFIGAAWNMIERDMNKEGLTSVPVELSPVEQQTMYRVLNDRWPADCDKQMPAVVQQSMANCLSFYERVDKLKKTLDVAIEKFDDARPERVTGPDASLYWFIKSLMASFGPANLTVEQWLAKVRQRLNAVQESDPNGWKGNLLNWVWSEKNRIFADTYVDNTRIDKWTELMKRLTKEAQRGAQR